MQQSYTCSLEWMYVLHSTRRFSLRTHLLVKSHDRCTRLVQMYHFKIQAINYLRYDMGD